MSDIIRRLPDSVANQIAAGEVIQRPSSAIKELVENAADAGATDIKVIVKDAGKTLIQVVDNGRGMSATDVRMAFERHATSKIQHADDLFMLATMGFRGEALPSICAISEVDVKTREKDSPLGTHIVISGSRIDTQEPCVCDVGTVITVKKLFYNVPARRKFLKSDAVELSNIVREFERLALVNNNISLSLDTGSKRIDLRKGTFKQRIIELWKSGLDAQLIPIKVETGIVKIEGFVSRPEYARKRNALQFLIANGRNMRHLYFHKAVLSCYENLIAPDTQPCYFLKFEVSPSSVDVNRSPTKDDIKFEDELQIRNILTASIKGALGTFSAVPSIDFSQDALTVLPPKEGEIPEEPTISISPGYNPFSASTPSSVITDWESLYNNFQSGFESSVGHSNGVEEQLDVSVQDHFSNNGNVRSKLFDDIILQSESDNESESNIQEEGEGGVDGETHTTDNSTLFDEMNSKEIAPMCIQHGLRYIITSSSEGVIIVDQHRAHLRVLYEENLKLLERATIVGQRVMFPDVLELDSSQQIILREIKDELSEMGFALEPDQDDQWQIVCVPSILKGASAKDLILRIIDSISEDSINYGKDSITETTIKSKMALMMARASAIRRGDKLTVTEMEHLVGSLFALPNPRYTSTGSQIFMVLDGPTIDKFFK